MTKMSIELLTSCVKLVRASQVQNSVVLFYVSDSFSVFGANTKLISKGSNRVNKQVLHS